jgi:formylglycine-generating enzyme required for sulfatase activity
MRVLRGNTYLDLEQFLRVAHRTSGTLEERPGLAGVRCARAM